VHALATTDFNCFANMSENKLEDINAVHLLVENKDNNDEVHVPFLPRHISAVGRVLRKHPYSKYLTFLDIVYANPMHSEDVEFLGPYSPPKSDYYEFASLVVKKGDSEDLEGGEPLQTLAVVAGDVVEFHGVIQNLVNYSTTHTERPSIFVVPQHLVVVQAWSMEGDGFFAFHPQNVFSDREVNFDVSETVQHQVDELDKRNAINFATAGSLTFTPPCLALQCKTLIVPRVLTVLRLLLSELDEKAMVRESVTSLVKSSDRLLMIWSSLNVRSLIGHLTGHPVLSTAIMRLYNGHCSSTIFGYCDASIQRTISTLNSSFLTQPMVKGVRLQAFPKSVTRTIIDGSTETFPWTPRGQTHSLSVCMCDGLWFLSLVSSEDAFVGDLREKPNSTSGKGNVQDVCRAQAKLEEALRRRGWLYDSNNDMPDQPLVLHHYRFAVDIGASPGGWSLCLAALCHAERVLSVDKGLLTLSPWPSAVAHWKVLGNEAIERIIAERAGRHLNVVDVAPEGNQEIDVTSTDIDFYCCDANVPPEDTVQMLVRCIEASLLADQARVVVTFKNVYRRRADWEQSVPSCLEQLKSHGLQQIQIMHLLANTQRETTITAVYCPL
jgi:hypothetical protein